MTNTQEQIITHVMGADNATIVSMCRDIYYRKYDTATRRYSDLTFTDEIVLNEYKFRNMVTFEEVAKLECDPREITDYQNKIYDCIRFTDIRNGMMQLIGELKVCEESSSEWFIKLSIHIEALRSLLEAWVSNTAELSIECQSLAREFKSKL